MRRVAVIGVGVTKFGKHDRTSSELFAEAAADALADAEISASRVQALYYGNVVGSETEHQLHTGPQAASILGRSEEHTSELQSHSDLVCRLLLEKNNMHSRDDQLGTGRRDP